MVKYQNVKYIFKNSRVYISEKEKKTGSHKMDIKCNILFQERKYLKFDCLGLDASPYTNNLKEVNPSLCNEMRLTKYIL